MTNEVITSSKGKTVEVKMSDSDAVNLLRTRSDDFARSLVQSAEQGKITHNRRVWLHVLANDVVNPPKPVSTSVGDVTPFLAMVATAKKHLKYPKYRLQLVDGSPVVLSVCGPRSKYTGQINVTDGGPFGQNVWYGRIDLAGTFNAGRSATVEVSDLLKRFMANPAEVAAEYGKLTGNCCFCNLGLTDERSTSVGYGPVCAKNHGLPWK